jgi:kinesin family member C1
MSSSRLPASGFAQSVGPNVGRSNSMIARSQTSMSFHRSTDATQRPSANRMRPKTAMTTHPAEEDELPNGKQSCTKLPLSLRPSTQSVPNALPERRLRKAASVQCMGPRASAPGRVLSISTMMGKLSLNDERPNGILLTRDQAISTKENCPPSPSPLRQSEFPLEHVTFRPAQSRREDGTQSPVSRLGDSRASIMAPPKTPPDSAQHAMDMLDKFEETLLASTRKCPESPSKSASKAMAFLTKDSNLTSFTAWDMDDRLVEMEAQFKAMKDVMNVSLTDKKAMEEVIAMAKTRGRHQVESQLYWICALTPAASDLERERNRLDEKNIHLQSELDSMRQQLQSLTLDIEQERRSYKYELEIKSRDHLSELDQLQRSIEEQVERLGRQHQEELDALKRHYRVELEEEKMQATREVQELRSKLGSEQDGLNLALQNKDREIQNARAEMDILKGDLEREQTQKVHLKQQMDDLVSTNTTLEGTVRSLQAQVHFLESDSKQQSDAFSEMEARMQEALVAADEARQKLIKEETERRALFNKYQELKGNIRVMCRVRPVLGDSEGTTAELDFPDDKTSAQIYVKGPEEKNALGKTSSKTYPFEFDRVFTPQIHNEEVFGEISQLVQSALDGYNVCIFCYGQTGSGKTYTMSSEDGMIPRATKMIYDTVNKLKEKSWSYTMEGNFVEVYNEELHDLLTPVKEAEGKRKPEIRHDEARKTTTVVNCKSVPLDSEDTVEQMLKQAQNNRSVAATKANERSSRSHSVFILKLIGENSATHERCEGTLNLVDLAGSERLKHSGAEGDRMKETQNINKSLTCLGDVIEALGKGNGHIPYRNSQLTYLLKNSLGGNSKTLMFVMVSPLEAHLKETLTSLRFATKVSRQLFFLLAWGNINSEQVHNTHIGTAKATKKTKERIGDL